jgi:DNA replication and repair protein RecF
MILKKIKLKNFRNYEDEEISFNSKFNYIYGDNGHGKTNILEAISYSSLAKSFLGSAESDCVKIGNDEFFIDCLYENDIGNSEHIIINYNQKSKQKNVVLNKEKLNRTYTTIFGRFPIVFFSPHSMNITYGNPSERRRFFDIMISQSSRVYFDYLRDLIKLLKQKNTLLRNNLSQKNYTPEMLNDLLAVYNEKLSDISTDIIFKRLQFISEYRNFFERNFLNLINKECDKCDNALIYYGSEILGEVNYKNIKDFGHSIIKEKVSEFISSKSTEEISRGMSVAGPHRDDYIFRITKQEESGNVIFDLRSFASQGEHKTFLVALKLSEFDFLKDKKASNPVLLLDDVLSELDKDRVSRIISHLKEFGQIFLTTTETGYVDNLLEFYNRDEISTFEVINGKVSKNEEGTFSKASGM